PYDPTVAATPPQGTPLPPPPPPATHYGPQGGSSYGSPNIPTDPYSSPPVGPYAPSGPGPYGPPPTPPRKSNLGKVLLIVGAVLLVIVAACCGTFFIIARNASNNVVSSLNATATAIAATASAEESTASSSLTPTTTVAPTTSNQQGPSPSGSPIAPSASAIVTKVQMADQVNDVTPTHLASTFKTHQTIYATFQIKSGNSGYMVAKWYLNDVHAFDNKILQVKSSYDAGYFAGYYNLAGQGAVEIYWCTTSDCSDAQLAQVATFTVEESS
ncbi:MAG: hypothetical protein IRZ31_19965, partial [Thermogemmatispora sp.]|nr:hypothetical protein [Thermogemmatispora sp.]